MITLRGNKLNTFVSFEKLIADKPTQPVNKKNANNFWGDVAAAFKTAVENGRDPDVAIKDLQLTYNGIGKHNQERLKKMLS
jgi:hypothetical protein